MTNTPIEGFVVCPRGLEAALADELGALSSAVRVVETARGGVAIETDLAGFYAVNLHSRLASRVLRRVGQARYRNDDDLYKLAARTPWETLLSSELTLRVDVTAVRSPLRSLNFATLRIKDGIVDRLRTQTGTRPSIDTQSPEMRVFGFLDERHLTLYVDTSGESLFKRGWRAGSDAHGEAPLKENLAAGLLALAGWQPSIPLMDPFCGSGTIAIEAAQRAWSIAPGRARAFAFQRLPGFDAALWSAALTQADANAAAAAARPVAEPMTRRPGRHASNPAAASEAASASADGYAVDASVAPTLPIFASDIDPRAVELTRANAAHAGLPDAALRISQRDAAQAPVPFDRPGLIVCNPPYGERMQVRGSDLAKIAEHWKGAYAGWNVALLTSDPLLPRQLGMKERRKIPLFNGALECRLFIFEIRARHVS